jgi:hypothetical protein
VQGGDLCALQGWVAEGVHGCYAERQGWLGVRMFFVVGYRDRGGVDGVWRDVGVMG